MKYRNKSVKASDYLKTVLVFITTFIIIICLFSLHKFIIIGRDVDWNFSRFLYFSLTVFLLFALLFFYLNTFAKGFFIKRKNIYLICVLILVTTEINILLGWSGYHYLRPYALIVMFGTIFISRRIGFFIGLFNALLIFLFDYFLKDYSFTAITAVTANYQEIYVLVISFFACVLAVMFTNVASRRLRTLLIGIKLAVPLFAVTLFAELFFKGQNLLVDSLVNALICAASGIITAALYILTLPIFENAFNIITIYRLIELTDHDKILLKRLKDEAPGTFNHSLSVANLSEACAAVIGENVQLARAAAYYHDIGKLGNPEYYVENQKDYNPHDDITPELSTDIIKRHIKDGYSLTKKYNLPGEIADVCLQHHGTMPIKVFYYKALKYTEGTLDMAQFCYDGVKPQTKIAAIIMIADSAEAAIRSLKDHSTANVEETVNAIIEERMDLGQFMDCDITMKEIYQIRDTIVDSFTGMYHERIKYPKMKLKAISSVQEREEE